MASEIDSTKQSPDPPLEPVKGTDKTEKYISLLTGLVLLGATWGFTLLKQADTPQFLQIGTAALGFACIAGALLTGQIGVKYRQIAVGTGGVGLLIVLIILGKEMSEKKESPDSDSSKISLGIKILLKTLFQ